MQTITTDISSQESLYSVDTSEIAFAMALFDAATKGQIHGADIGVSGFPLRENQFDLEDMEQAGDTSEDSSETSSESARVSRAVSILWHHYNGDDRQRTIWCRVVAFHVMMVRSRGDVVKRWTRPCLEDSTTSFLDPAVVHAVAAAPLSEFGEFSDVHFLETAGQFTNFSLVASKAASLAPPEAPQVRVFENLRRSVAALTGRHAFDALLSRAMAGSSSKFPWLKSAKQLTPSELFEAIDKGQADPSAKELAEAEATVVASMVGLLNTLLGESVTLRLLHNAWADDAGNSIAGKPNAAQHIRARSFGQTNRNA